MSLVYMYMLCNRNSHQTAATCRRTKGHTLLLYKEPPIASIYHRPRRNSCISEDEPHKVLLLLAPRACFLSPLAWRCCCSSQQPTHCLHTAVHGSCLSTVSCLLQSVLLAFWRAENILWGPRLLIDAACHSRTELEGTRECRSLCYTSDVWHARAAQRCSNQLEQLSARG